MKKIAMIIMFGVIALASVGCIDPRWFVPPAARGAANPNTPVPAAPTALPTLPPGNGGACVPVALGVNFPAQLTVISLSQGAYTFMPNVVLTAPWIIVIDKFPDGTNDRSTKRLVRSTYTTGINGSHVVGLGGPAITSPDQCDPTLEFNAGN